MEKKKVTELSDILDTDQKKRKATTNKISKNLLRLLGYIIEVGASSILGGISSLAIIGWYPAMIPGLLGLAGPIGYLILQTKVSIGVFKKKTSKATVFSAILAFIASLVSYILGLYYGLAKINVFGAGSLYGVFSKRKTQNVE